LIFLLYKSPKLRVGRSLKMRLFKKKALLAFYLFILF
jgi:hypothetical protein